MNSAINIITLDSESPSVDMSFDEFCHALEDIPYDYQFLSPYMGILPGRQAVTIAAPISEVPGKLEVYSDIDSAHLISDTIPAVGPVGVYTLMNFNFTINHRNHFTVPIAGISEPVELCRLSNYRIAEFGFGNRWKVIRYMPSIANCNSRSTCPR